MTTKVSSLFNVVLFHIHYLGWCAQIRYCCFYPAWTGRLLLYSLMHYKWMLPVFKVTRVSVQFYMISGNMQYRTVKFPKCATLEHVYIRPEVNSDRFEISNRFEMLFRLHGNLHKDFTAASFQLIARSYCTCANDIF